MKKIIGMAVIGGWMMVGCQQPTQQEIQETESSKTFIDSALQAKTMTVLEEKLEELNAFSGQVVVMETQTGAVKTMVGLQRRFDATYEPCINFAYQQETGLMRTFTVMAALETGKVKLTDKVDTGNGCYLVNGVMLKDHNWHRGGYGVIDYGHGLQVSSNIATYKAAKKAFANPQSYFDALDRLCWGGVDSISGIDGLMPRYSLTPKDTLWEASDYPYSTIGYRQSIAPIQILASYNAIANGGVMVRPCLMGETEVIKEQIATPQTIKVMQEALRNNVSIGLAKPAGSELANVAGTTGTIDVGKNGYLVQFCGYFPAEAPRYSIIVSINKPGLPASGGLMAGTVFSKIVDYIMERG